MSALEEASIPQPAKLAPDTPDWLVVIAANTGGPQALAHVLPQVPSDFPGSVLVLQQMRRGFTSVLAQQLASSCQLPVVEPVDGQALTSGKILIPPSHSLVTVRGSGPDDLAECSLLIEESVGPGEAEQSVVDHCMASAASQFGPNTVGVLLTGVGRNGVDGLRIIGEAGGITMAQEEASCVVHDLPGRAIEAGVVQHVVPLWSIADRVVQATGGQSNAAAA